MRVSPKQYAQALIELLTDATHAERTERIQQFLQTLYHKGELKLLSEIVRHVERLDDQQRGVLPVQVTIAQTHTPAVIAHALSSVLPKKRLRVTTQIDERVVGGVRVETQDSRWDISVSGQLAQLRAALMRTHS